MNVLPGSSWAGNRGFVRDESTLSSYAGGDGGGTHPLLPEAIERAMVGGLASSCVAEGEVAAISTPLAGVGDVCGSICAFLRLK